MCFKHAIIIIMILLLSSCASTAKYEAILDGWLQQDINKLINEWGYPHNSLQLPNGNIVYIFGSSDSGITPAQTYTHYRAVGDKLYADSVVTGGYAYNYWCRTFFEVNADNVIVKWRVEGNSCISR